MADLRALHQQHRTFHFTVSVDPQYPLNPRGSMESNWDSPQIKHSPNSSFLTLEFEAIPLPPGVIVLLCRRYSRLGCRAR